MRTAHAGFAICVLNDICINLGHLLSRSIIHQERLQNNVDCIDEQITTPTICTDNIKKALDHHMVVHCSL